MTSSNLTESQKKFLKEVLDKECLTPGESALVEDVFNSGWYYNDGFEKMILNKIRKKYYKSK